MLFFLFSLFFRAVKRRQPYRAKNSEVDYIFYAVKTGETIRSIAAKFNIPIEDILKLNGDKSLSYLHGLTLRIPIKRKYIPISTQQLITSEFAHAIAFLTSQSVDTINNELYFLKIKDLNDSNFLRIIMLVRKYGILPDAKRLCYGKFFTLNNKDRFYYQIDDYNGEALYKTPLQDEDNFYALNGCYDLDILKNQINR